MSRVYVAAGSNVDPEANLARALDALRRIFPGLIVSSCYRNRAVGFEGDDFLNLAVGFDTGRSVDEVIAALQAVEAECGRTRDAPKWAPRPMDLDILLFDDLVCETPSLRLPRPDLLRRAYMLGPLAEIAPDEMHPTAHRTIGVLWSGFDQAAHPLQRVTLPMRQRTAV
jgi:2-amino-4-hydroxy-6-hydroxymethyldihydropteridine diphosphokinase